MTRTLIDDCFLHDKNRLRHSEAIAILKERLAPVVASQNRGIGDAAGRILASPVLATRNIPFTDNSAVDGYAYNSAEYDETGGFFPIGARLAAGPAEPLELPPRMAARIFTGAVMPQNADTIAMQEDCEPHEQDGIQFVAIPPGLKPGANRRRAGEDLNEGAEIAAPGALLSPQLVAAIASTGIGEIETFKPLKVAILSSGNELLEPGKPARSGQVHDSNRHLMMALLARLPIEVTDLGIQPDKYDEIEKVLAEAAQAHDAIITSGGASLGEEDHIIAALESLGKRHLWQLAVKPGRPMSFGQIGSSVFFGLPGNPVACFVCYLLYVRPSLLRLGGAKWHEPQRFPLPVLFDFDNKKPDRREFWRGIVSNGQDGRTALRKFSRDGSGLITGLREADGLIEVPESVTRVKSGDQLDFIPWSSFGI